MAMGEAVIEKRFGISNDGIQGSIRHPSIIRFTALLLSPPAGGITDGIRQLAALPIRTPHPLNP